MKDVPLGKQKMRRFLATKILATILRNIKNAFFFNAFVMRLLVWSLLACFVVGVLCGPSLNTIVDDFPTFGPLSFQEDYSLDHVDIIMSLIDTLQDLGRQPDQRISSRMASSEEPAVHVSTFSPLPLKWRKEITSSCGHERHKHGTSLIDTLKGLFQQPDQRNSSKMVQSDGPIGLVSTFCPFSQEGRGRSLHHVDMSATSMALCSFITCRLLNYNLTIWTSGNVPRRNNLMGLYHM
jgi:hypothetical protein